WGYNFLEDQSGERRPLTREERDGSAPLPDNSRIFQLDNITSQGATPSGTVEFVFRGNRYHTGVRSHWKTTLEGMNVLAEKRRIQESDNQIRYVRYFNDFPLQPLTNLWTDTTQAGYVDAKLYAVQTVAKVIQRCTLMTTDPGDLVLDPTCGSGTTAYVAEQWGRRWITIDTSRVPLALARQRLLTATFPYYDLHEEARGPAGGFVYKRRQNKKGEEVCGVVPHITLKSITNNEPPQEEILVDRPETVDNIVRVAGPFAVEATIPSPIDVDSNAQEEASQADEEYASFLERMMEVLRKSPILQVGGGKAVTLKSIRPAAKSLALSAEAIVEITNGKDNALQSAIDAAHEVNTGGLRFSQQAVAIVFGPENGAVSEKLVFEAAREAHAKNFTHLYVIGFAIQANARSLIETCDATVGIPATYVQATPDLVMGDLLKTTRASEIFSVCGMPEMRLKKLKPEKVGE